MGVLGAFKCCTWHLLSSNVSLRTQLKRNYKTRPNSIHFFLENKELMLLGK